MKFVYTRKMDDDCTVVVEGESTSWAVMASAYGQCQLIFEQRKCVKCLDEGRKGDHGTLLQKRISSGYQFFEQTCLDPVCGAALGLGQRQEDNLFYPKRFNSKKRGGGAKAHFGWDVFEFADDDGPQVAQPGYQQPPYQQAATPQQVPPMAAPAQESDIPF